jgi:hypothetical protein
MGKRYLRRAGCMDPRFRESMIGPARQRLAAPTLAAMDGDDVPELNSHEELNTSGEGEIHPQPFSDDATRRRLGLDPIHA